MDAKMRFWRACQKTLAKRPKMFRSCWNFLNKMQKSFSQGPEMEKRKSIFRQKSSKEPLGQAKSSWEIFGAKVFAKKY